MAYVKRHPIKTNMAYSLEYITNEKKTDEKLLVFANACPPNPVLTNKFFEKTKKEFRKEDGVLGIHFIQSFDPKEKIDSELAHEVGKKWADKFLSDYEYILTTHKDKEHLHNHIIINSVSYKTGMKYFKNDKELYRIRDLSDEVCKEKGLSIITSDRCNIYKKYGEIEKSKNNISWKDKIKIDIDKSITSVNDYGEFISDMTSKGYEMKYGDVKYNSFKHMDMKKSCRGKTLGDDYTEQNIKERINQYKQNRVRYLKENKKNINFEKEKFYKNLSNRDVVKADIDLSINQSLSYEEFISDMTSKGYEMKYGDVKYNTFKHMDMKRCCRGKTLGDDYTEESIKERINKLNYIRNKIEERTAINFNKNTIFQKKYVNNKFKYLKSTDIRTENRKQIDLENYKLRKEQLKENKTIEILKKYKVNSLNELLEVDTKLKKVINKCIDEYEVIQKKLDVIEKSIKKDFSNARTKNDYLELIQCSEQKEKEILNYKDIRKDLSICINSIDTRKIIKKENKYIDKERGE